ncbi:hypothetical protein EVAR_92278_1 [Eumeta japonica]|uniref:Uncharacterized protein n=1 Tax=Eumeta variegata TaxID=151549 RepID=A0A4C1TM38_EUMVA|nr:hypothetical protein EVAR_92278_1 [Eumeta japonica]
MVVTEQERIKVGKFQDQNVKDEYAERLKGSFVEIIIECEYLELDELRKATSLIEPMTAGEEGSRVATTTWTSAWNGFPLGRLKTWSRSRATIAQDRTSCKFRGEDKC